MRTVGVDLSAEPAGTAVATLDWADGVAVVTELVERAADEVVLAAVEAADKAGIDCPFGWPLPFVEFVSGHRDGHVSGHPTLEGRDWRRVLANRTTDEVVRRKTGLIPLSVAADRIGHAAFRCAWLLSQLAGRGVDVHRAGTGRVVEVYPAASLKVWRLSHRGYKGIAHQQARDVLVTALRAAAPWLDLGAYDAVCRASDHALDAVVAALSARAAALGLVTTPAGDQAAAAAVEGWIAVPTAGIDALTAAEPPV
jgi:predicted nuclease with RNAse H fold